MKNYWIKDLTERQVIHAPTKDIAKKLCNKFHELGLKWSSGKSYLNEIHWSDYEEETCYSLFDGEFCYLDYYTLYGYEILTIDQLLDFQENEYPKVMDVSDNNKSWHKRVVFMEKSGKFLAWAGAETIEESEDATGVTAWSYAREIQSLPTLESTIDQVTEKFNISHEQIKNKEVKKEEITVKLTINNLQKVLKTLEKNKQNCIVSYNISSLKNNIYLFYSADSNLWRTSPTKPKDKTLIKPKELKKLLENEPTYTSKYWNNPLWQGQGLYTAFDQNSELTTTKSNINIGNKGTEHIPENKTLEVGKWYKYPSLLDGKLIFLFMGEFGDHKANGFNSEGEYHDAIGVHEHKIPEYIEAKPEEVIEAFIYHMENFAN